jgi:hypothetical protein
MKEKGGGCFIVLSLSLLFIEGLVGWTGGSKQLLVVVLLVQQQPLQPVQIVGSSR